jgi:hypothetical protein
VTGESVWDEAWNLKESSERKRTMKHTQIQIQVQ